MAVREVDDLVRAIKATGSYDVESGSTHYKVVNESGNTVYTLPKSPSDSHWRENAVHGLIRVGVLDVDPKKAVNRKKSSEAGASHLARPEIQALKIAAVKARHAKYAAITADIRNRIEPLITKVGGWGMRQGQITAAELGMVAMHWGRNRPDVFRSENGARTSAQSNLKQGGTMSEGAANFWDAFVTAWEAAEDQRSWYFDLVREMKGLQPIEKRVIVGGETVKPPSRQKNLRRAGRVSTYVVEDKKHPLEPDRVVGHLALKAVLLMAVGSETINQNEILEVGEQILALETRVSGEERE
jgi:hypothetical protein